ncbi:hypothetical protein FIV34_00415 [Luteibacter pinisoli]|uniref:Toxin-antitoxin system YwqK family antitoxin n=1 Tax=Luteibacter pinisoli TaxID=2589080 RepID=A0A4Y5YYX2_9GAMM|nr:hypothetical protein [Luteibacter pinisoli]QDE37766.1 hypothetical protein FIV34_00415 [Luteibacter pinisoli]
MTDKTTETHRRFHKDGSLRGEWTTIDGKREGVARIWHTNGRLFTEATFLNNLAEGVIREWAEDGRLTLEAHVVNGEYHGSYESWFDDGSPKRKGMMDMGKKLPGSVEYHPDGSVWWVIE